MWRGTTSPPVRIFRSNRSDPDETAGLTAATGPRRSGDPDVDGADRALAPTQDQVAPVQEVGPVRYRIFGGDLGVVEVGPALGDGPPGRRLAVDDAGQGHQVAHRGQRLVR